MNIIQLLDQIKTIGREYPAAYEFVMKEPPKEVIDTECVCDDCLNERAEEFKKLLND